MHKDIHRNNGTRPDRPPVAAVFAPPDIPPSARRPPGRLPGILGANEDYRSLFKLMFQALDFFDRCQDCEALLDAGMLFRFLTELADDALEEEWGSN